MSRRRAVLAFGLVALLVTSGCIGFITGSEELSFDAEPVAVSDSATQEAGYDQLRREANTINRTFSVAGQERTVTATNQYAEYGRSVDRPLFGDQRVAQFTAFATPQVEVAGQTLNPVSNLNNRELVLRLQQQYQSLENVRFESNRTQTVLSSEATVSKFRADATLQGGQEVEVFVHITKVKHEGDYVIAVAVHPTQIDEQGRVNTMLGGLEHPAPAPE
ncbi:DUF6517 family protein [Halorarius halobius]|uniref:DUF6517 family protein n=1 Tax=Halorarius halobius TaxID=2962671 RepID=UPI0020CC9186|nr:DUF6517 family protein [Halorarius halobius]